MDETKNHEHIKPIPYIFVLLMKLLRLCLSSLVSLICFSMFVHILSVQTPNNLQSNDRGPVSLVGWQQRTLFFVSYLAVVVVISLFVLI
jgi:hypothetical protein